MSTPASSRRRWASLAGAALLVLGCQRPSETPQAYAARVAVQRYNQRLPDAFRAARADLLEEVARPAEISRVSSVIAGLTSQGKYMEARQLELTVLEVRVDEQATPPTATVRAHERWTYQHRWVGVPDSQRPEQKEADYRMTYTVVREGGRWMVEKAAVDDR